MGYLAPCTLGVGYPCRPALLPNWDGLRPLRTTSQLQEHRQWVCAKGFVWGFPFLHAVRKLPVARVRREHGSLRPGTPSPIAGGVSLVARLTLPSPQRTCGSPALYINQDAVPAESQTVTPLFCLPPIVACLQTRCDQPRYRRG